MALQEASPVFNEKLGEIAPGNVYRQRNGRRCTISGVRFKEGKKYFYQFDPEIAWDASGRFVGDDRGMDLAEVLVVTGCYGR